MAGLSVRLAPLEALDQAIIRLEDQLFVPHGDDDHFDLHQLPMAQFLSGMNVCEQAPARRFIDIGCGIGTKLLVAHFLGWDVHGIERHADYAEVARRLAPEATVDVGNAWDITDLTQFDVVYSYRLAVDIELQHRLNAHIVSKMKPGALFFCPASDPFGATHVGDTVWRV